MKPLQELVEDTYAEGFRSIYGEILITAHNEQWLKHCAAAVCGHATSTIMCECEAGVSQWIDEATAATGGTPDGRPGCIVQFHVPRFRKDRERHLEKVMLARIGQNVLTCPTARCFNRLDTPIYFKLGRKIAYFGDGHQFRDVRYHEKGWVIPIMSGEFFLSRRFGFSDGIMGGNLWFMSTTSDAALAAAEQAAAGAATVPGAILSFPGGVASSASKAGSKYKFLIASTFAEYCPTLKSKLGDQSRVPDGVQSITEIVINGANLETVALAMKAAIHASAPTEGLVRITAGNYGGRLGKSFVHLHPLL
jgi:formylmethanofuran--tetrahydromethanopterin N-formyltransferase